MVIIHTHSWKHLLLLAKFKHAPPTTNSWEMVSQISKYTMNSAETPTLTPMQTHFIRVNCGCLVARSCPALCNSRDCGRQAPLSLGFPRQEYWSGVPFPPPGQASRAALVVKKPPANAGDSGSTPGSGRPPRRKWQPSPVFLPGNCHGRRSLAGYSPWGRKELDTTEHTPRRHLPDPGTKPSLWHQQADPFPLSHLGSPRLTGRHRNTLCPGASLDTSTSSTHPMRKGKSVLPRRNLGQRSGPRSQDWYVPAPSSRGV